MEKRLLDCSRPINQSSSNRSKKSKKRSSRRSNLPGTRPNGTQNEQDGGGSVPGMEYHPRMLWQSNVPQNVPHDDGQRLFTAMSDPSVCGYSPMPLTYAMQPVSLPAMYRLYHPVPFPNARTDHNGSRRERNDHLANACSIANSNIHNGYRSMQENGLESSAHAAYQNGDYASLPSTANKNDSINGDELNSEHRRYSDPGFGPAENSVHSESDDSDSIESGSSITTIDRSNKLVLSLIEQMTELKKCNSQLFKELSETKADLENIKIKLIQCKHSSPSDYQPGMLSEFIREIREANKNYEEGLIMKVKSMLEARHSQQLKEMEEFKNQLSKLIKEKEESGNHITKLEEEVAALKLSVTNEGREIAAFEEETLALRRELQEARASRNLAENHAAKLEKLVEILRKKMNGATATETVNRIRDVLTSGIYLVPEGSIKEQTNRVPSSSSSTEDEENEAAVGDNDDDDDDDNDNVDGEKPDTSMNDKSSSIANDPKVSFAIDNNVNLSGPVTDL